MFKFLLTILSSIFLIIFPPSFFHIMEWMSYRMEKIPFIVNFGIIYLFIVFLVFYVVRIIDRINSYTELNSFNPMFLDTMEEIGIGLLWPIFFYFFAVRNIYSRLESSVEHLKKISYIRNTKS